MTGMVRQQMDSKESRNKCAGARQVNIKHVKAQVSDKGPVV
jgi:hypothetical protein